MKKLNLTKQKHAFTNQKKCTTTQKTQKTKARFSRLLPTSGLETDRAYSGFGTSQICYFYLLTKTLTQLLTARDPHGATSTGQLL